MLKPVIGMARGPSNWSGAVRVIAVLMALVGLGMSIWGYRNVRDAQDSKTWPAVEGIVTDSHVETASNYDKTRRQSVPISRASVTYDYTVDGRTYSGNRVSFLGTGRSLSHPGYSTDLSIASRALARYPSGKTVQVYYDPKRPESSVLEPGAARDINQMLWAGAAFLVFGIGIGIYAFRRHSGEPLTIESLD